MGNLTKKIVTFLVAAGLGIFMAAAQTKTVTHTVNRGETLESIAKRYGTTNKKIIELNPDAEQFIYVGMELVIPVTIANEVQQSTKAISLQENDLVGKDVNHNTVNDNLYLDNRDEAVKENLHSSFFVAQYQLGDFTNAKYSSCYGLGIFFPSVVNWGALHIGGNLNFSINAGVVKEWGCLIDFGPSVRYDIAENVFFNMPVDVRCAVTIPEGTTDTHADWGLQLAPAIHVFFTKKFGIYFGPQMTIGFYSGAKPAFGLVAGISFDY